VKMHEVQGHGVASGAACQGIVKITSRVGRAGRSRTSESGEWPVTSRETVSVAAGEAETCYLVSWDESQFVVVQYGKTQTVFTWESVDAVEVWWL